MESQLLLHPPHEQACQLSDKQNLAIVQIFLNAAVACIAHTRELIPWVSNCFQTRYVHQLLLEPGNSNDLYRDFCNGPGVGDAKSQEFRILQRGQDKRADCILDLLDKGISDALGQGVLDAFQILITANTTDPASTLEIYTFSFDYEHGDVTQINFSVQTVDPFSIKNVHRSFTASIRSLLRSLKDLPRLPRQRSLGVSLLYNKNCAPDYQPTGFVDSKQYHQMPIRGSWSDLWHDSPAPFTYFTTGMQKVAIGVRSLQLTNGSSCSRLQDSNMAMQLRRMQKTSSQLRGPESTEAPLPSANSYEQDNGMHQNAATRRSTILPANTPGDHQTQAISPSHTSGRSVNSLAKLSVAAKNRRRRNIVAGKLAELIVQARALENNRHGTSRLFDEEQFRDGKIKRLDRCGSIRCECGSGHEAPHMLLCELCGTKQHKVCYGYDSLRQGCLPEEHFCYDCLLLPREDKISQSMPATVHMRLALLFLAKQPRADVDIGQNFLHSIFRDREDSRVDFLTTIDRLTEEGYISERHNGIAYILDNDKLVEAQALYLDPLAGIMHHFQIVRDGDTFGKRKQEVLRALKMYVGDRQFSISDKTNSLYDRIHVRNNDGQEVIRWGFYASWKRKAVDSLESNALRQKMSISDGFLNIDRSTCSENMSIDEALQDAVSEAEWDLRLDSRLSSADINFN